MLQRSRWARGMFEGLRKNPPTRQPRVLAKFVAGIDYLVPFLDVGYIFFWIPGFILFVLGYPLLFSWWSMLDHPGHHADLRISPVLAGAPRLPPRSTSTSSGTCSGFLRLSSSLYQAITSTAALHGYMQYLIGRDAPLEVARTARSTAARSPPWRHARVRRTA